MQLITWKEILSKIAHADTAKGPATFACGDHLYVRVIGRQRRAAWYVRTKDRHMQRLGEFGAMSLSQARRMALDRYNQTTDSPQNIKGPVLFGQLAQEWLSTKQDLKRYPNLRRSIDILADLNNIPVPDLRISQVKEALLSQDVSPYQLNLAISSLCRIMDLAIENEIIESHNFEILKHSQVIPKHRKGEGFAWKPVTEFTALFNDVLQLPAIQQIYFMLVPMLCLRPGECLQLKFEYFDCERAVLYVPGEVMKIKRAQTFRVPLSEYAVRLMRLAQQQTTFSNQQYLFVKIHTDAPPQLGRFSEVWRSCTGGASHLHGFRKSARSWMSEHEVSFEVAAKCLDHELSLGADIFYQKSDLFDLRRPVMEAWNKAVYDNLPEQLQKMIMSVRL